MNKREMLRCLPATLAASLAVTATPAYCEDEQLESIVVTAQSRTQTEREVPIAMQVVGVQQIEALGADNLSDINGYVPGLVVDGSQPTQPNFALRGIGTGDFGIATDAPVGVYVDGIYTGKTGGSLLNFNDVQRVEVLKGPQGTLFGRNSAAGAISIVNNEPESATDADATLRYGRYNTRVFNGMLNLPLSDTTAVRFSAEGKYSDGWVTDQTTGESMGGDGTWGTRLSFKWAPSSDTKVITSWEHERLNQPARPAFGLVEAPAGTRPPFPPTPSEFVDPITAPLLNDSPNRETRTFDGLSVRLEKQLAGLQFTSISAYRHFSDSNGEDNDGTANPYTYLNTINAEVNTSYQQEFKLASKDERRDWVVGASFYRVIADQYSTVNTNTESIDTLFLNSPGAPLFGNPLFPSVAGAIGAPLTLGQGNPWQEQMINSLRTTSYALYGDVIWHLTPATNLTTGLRWTTDLKSTSWYVPPYSAGSLDSQYLAATPALVGAPMTFGQAAGYALAGGVPGAPPLTNIVFQSASLAASTPVSASNRWGDLSPRLVLDQKFGAHTMGFASVSRGYQSGGFDVFSPFAQFQPEHMTNYEVGFKSSLPEARASFEGSVFRYLFTNLQSITLVNAGALPVYDVTNSDESAWGADFGGRMELTSNVSVFGAAEYLNQKYDQYSFTDHYTNVPVSLAGQPVGTPLLTITAGTRINWNAAGGKAEWVLQGAHTSPIRCNTQISEEFGCLNAGSFQTGLQQTRLDTRLGWTTADRRFGVALLVNNALNKQYVTGVGGQSTWTLGTPYSTVTPPRTYAIEFTASL